MGALGPFIAIGGIALVVGAWILHARTGAKASQSSRWPTAAGLMTANAVVHKVETDADGDSDDVYYVEPVYEYEVEGKTLTGKRIAFGGRTRFDNPQKAEAVVARYPAGASVMVHYNPRKPSECVLESTRPTLFTPILLTIVGLVFAVVGLGSA